MRKISVSIVTLALTFIFASCQQTISNNSEDFSSAHDRSSIISTHVSENNESSITSLSSSSIHHDHVYNNPLFEWSKDFENCNCVISCEECGEKRTLTASVEEQLITPTSSIEYFKTKYVAKATYGNKEFEDTKEIAKNINSNFEITYDFISRKDIIVNRYCLYENEAVVIPEEMLTETVLNVDIWFSRNTDVIPEIVIPNKKIVINDISCPNIDYSIMASACGLQLERPVIYLKFQGTLDDYLENVSFNNNRTFDSVKPYLFLLDENNNSYKLTNLVFSNSVTKIKKYAFSHINFDSVVFPSSLKEIGDFAFFYNTDLKQITFNEGLEKLSSGCFTYCSSLKKITLPSTLKTIDNPFDSCNNILEVEISEGCLISNIAQLGILRLIKVIDNTNSLSLGDYFLITKNNMQSSYIFEYNDFVFALVEDNLYLICTNKKCEELTLPNSVEFNGRVFTHYKVHEYAFITTMPLGAATGTIDELVEAYNGIDTLIQINSIYSMYDLFRTIYISDAVTSFVGQPFYNTCFLKNIYFDMTKEVANSRFTEAYLHYLTNDSNVNIYVKSSSNEYVSY